jgi:hypothetical protein
MFSLESLLTPSIGEFLFLLSVVSFIGSLITLPVILVRLPVNYFMETHPRVWLAEHHPVLRGMALVLKNLLGLVLLLGGLAMLVLPGQGVLTILIGVSLVDFPRKRALERRIVGRPLVLQTINRIRRRFNQPPLRV